MKFVIAPKSVTADKIADNCFTADKIESGAITTDKLADGAVTLDKVSFNITNPILSLLTKNINSIWEKLSDITGEPFNGLDFEVSPKYFISETPVPVHVKAMTGISSAVFDHIAFYINDNLIYETEGVNSVEFDSEVSETSVIRYSATILGLEYTGVETIIHYNSYWIGASKNYQGVMINENLKPVPTGLRGNYDISFTQGDKLFIILGSNLRELFVRADMNGIEIPFTEQVVVIDGSSYNILTSENTYIEGIYNIDVNG